MKFDTKSKNKIKKKIVLSEKKKTSKCFFWFFFNFLFWFCIKFHILKSQIMYLFYFFIYYHFNMQKYPLFKLKNTKNRKNRFFLCLLCAHPKKLWDNFLMLCCSHKFFLWFSDTFLIFKSLSQKIFSEKKARVPKFRGKKNQKIWPIGRNRPKIFGGKFVCIRRIFCMNILAFEQ